MSFDRIISTQKEMRELFRSIYPGRSMDEFERHISASPEDTLTPSQKEEWILEMTTRCASLQKIRSSQHRIRSLSGMPWTK